MKVSDDLTTLKMLKGVNGVTVGDLEEADHVVGLVQDQEIVVGGVEVAQGTGKY